MKPTARIDKPVDLAFHHDGIKTEGSVARFEPPALGPTLQAHRKRRRLTLDDVAEMSGVSRSMLSQIERGEANPTFATLWNLTRSLGLDIAELTGGAGASSRRGIEISSAGFTPEIRTDDGGCVLRILSPPTSAGDVEWYLLTLPSGGSLRSEPHALGAREHLTALLGALEVTSGDEMARLEPGATGRYAADVPHKIHNPGPHEAQALLVVHHQK